MCKFISTSLLQHFYIIKTSLIQYHYAYYICYYYTVLIFTNHYICYHYALLQIQNYVFLHNYYIIIALLLHTSLFCFASESLFL